MQWLSALKFALSRIHCQNSYGRHLKSKRRLEWHRQKIRRQAEFDRANKQLMTERMVEIPEYPELGLTKVPGFSSLFGKTNNQKPEI